MRIAAAAMYIVNIPIGLQSSCLQANIDACLPSCWNSCRPSCVTTLITSCLQHRVPPVRRCHECKSAFQLQLCVITLRQLVSNPKSFLFTQKEWKHTVSRYTPILEAPLDKSSATSKASARMRKTNPTHSHMSIGG